MLEKKLLSGPIRQLGALQKIVAYLATDEEPGSDNDEVPPAILKARKDLGRIDQKLLASLESIGEARQDLDTMREGLGLTEDIRRSLWTIQRRFHEVFQKLEKIERQTRELSKHVDTHIQTLQFPRVLAQSREVISACLAIVESQLPKEAISGHDLWHSLLPKLESLLAERGVSECGIYTEDSEKIAYGVTSSMFRIATSKRKTSEKTTVKAEEALKAVLILYVLKSSPGTVRMRIRFP